MRDRTLAMKWVMSLATECSGDSEIIIKKLHSRGVNQKTINDQMNRLKKQGLLLSHGIKVSDSNLSDAEELTESKPFNPVPKSKVAKKKH